MEETKVTTAETKATAEETKAAAEETKAAAAETNVEEAKIRTEVVLQYRGYEMNMDDVTERVKTHYMAKGSTEASIESMQIYVKPEDFTAYYVINDGVVGKVNLF